MTRLVSPARPAPLKAGKHITPPLPRPTPEPDAGCGWCNDMGCICCVCKAADGFCRCDDGPSLVACPECS